MAIPIIHDWERYFSNPHEGLGSSYERIILNELLLKVVQEYGVTSVLEAPSFGFTGISGINMLLLGKMGLQITLEDNEPRRLELIRDLWQNQLHISLKTKLNSDYTHLDYPDSAFDMGFNFSAMWFTKDLAMFIREFCRVCAKAILICVPNRGGIGYKLQIRDYTPEAYPEIQPGHIDAKSIIPLMHRQGWRLVSKGYIDCPPWPDIGMDKERFIGKILKRKEHKQAPVPVSILPYYRGEDSSFKSRMLRYAFVERCAPDAFKKFWAHHYHLLFVPDP